ncbi:MFS transporter [Morganella morganii]|uniref:MFS transporter n=1 Tax=Morganella morganii TaxID=582 RepID=UPI0013B47664|nr:MFS transporter [Morganella morganii]
MTTLFSDIGTWMNDVGTGWLMTKLNPDPVMIATIQAITHCRFFISLTGRGDCRYFR